MPIRINLLAEQQAAEEARRRDPVKRAFWVGGGLVGLMICWIVLLQFRIGSERGELARFETQLKAVEENSKETRQQWATSSQVDARIANLHRYSTNRFFSALLLDALQQLPVEDVRVVHLQSAHTCSTNAESTFKTNLVFAQEARASWQFWKGRPAPVDVAALVANQISAITNKVEAFKSPVDLLTKIELSTNQTQMAANIEIIKPTTAQEQITLTIKARDYSDPPGHRVDEFSKALATFPYFAQALRAGEGEGIRLRERAIQPEVDPLDPINPTKPFIAFIIECRYRGLTRANE